MDEEPTLPRLARNLTSEAHPVNPTKKRIRHSSFTAHSSDPAMFSSDDDPSADNYQRERSKKKFRGPWYRQVLASEGNSQESDIAEPTKKSDRKFERKYDSGVFLGSDGTDLDEVLDVLEKKQAIALPVRPAWTTSKIQQPEKSPEEVWVDVQIQRCLEDGNETIDLSSRGLSRISNAALRPLSTFTTVPPVSQDVFYRLEPDLKVWLSSNSLQMLPEELFLLERLTALSLRGNILRELPPAIGNPQNLRELNVSLNRLEYLPFEILNLFSATANLRSFSIHPNPFLQPQFPETVEQASAEGEVTEDDEVNLNTNSGQARLARMTPLYHGKPLQAQRERTRFPQWTVAYRARTDIRYFDKYGTLVKGPSFSSDDGGELSDSQKFVPTVDEQIEPEPPLVEDDFISRTPSLVELALKSCLTQGPQQPHIASLVQEHAPEHVQSLYESTATQRESGFGKCTICNREFVIKRTEWIEWWEIAYISNRRAMASMASPLGRMENERDSLESKVPLIRRGCSWSCVPRPGENADVLSDND